MPFLAFPSCAAPFPKYRHHPQSQSCLIYPFILIQIGSIIFAKKHSIILALFFPYLFIEKFANCPNSLPLNTPKMLTSTILIFFSILPFLVVCPNVPVPLPNLEINEIVISPRGSASSPSNSSQRQRHNAGQSSASSFSAGQKSPLRPQKSPLRPPEGIEPWPVPYQSCQIVKSEEMKRLLAESQSEIQLECEDENKGKNDGDEENPRILVDLGICNFSGHSYYMAMNLMRRCNLDKALIWIGNKCTNLCNNLGFPRCVSFINNNAKWRPMNGGENYPATDQVKKAIKVAKKLSRKMCRKMRTIFSGGQGNLLPESLHDL